ncbi:MAG: Holliday junction branch migration protein RuvA [Cyanophyceae cyanobacterium]
MIGLLDGEVVTLQAIAKRLLLLLNVQGVGYEVQILPRWRSHLTVGTTVRVHTHLQLRDDGLTLFGFASVAERDLFRHLIATNGVGPQLAIALMDALELPTLLQAIVGGNHKLLAKTPGIGPKTAERICLELKTKLAQWRDQGNLAIAPAAGPADLIREEVELTLMALGYGDREIFDALEAVGRQTALAKAADPEAWIREAIAWLSLQD